MESFSKRKKVEFWTRVVLLVVSEYQHYFFLDFDNRHTLTLSGRRSHKLPSLRYGAGRVFSEWPRPHSGSGLKFCLFSPLCPLWGPARVPGRGG